MASALWNNFSLLVLGLLVISSSNLLAGTLATDSEVVEAVIDVTGPNEPSKLNMESTWDSQGAMQVQPYNILEANCPEGYILANKHCHKRV
ncbi:uncharacterized protein [Drosophila kikkawai]|uniref:Uncharacterized protein n=1 Tax=Drosophila kikkawai TaxID=30033 RepID=A0ABM4GC92_DROKI|nr:hypothetical protein KR059_011329 [Drosophila kikkawai]